MSLTYEIPMYNVSNLQACGAAQNQQIDLCTCSHVSPMIAIKIRKHSAAQRCLLTVSRELKGTQETLMTCFDLFHVIHWFDCRDFLFSCNFLHVCMSVVQIISRQVRYLRIAERHKSYNPCRWVRTDWPVYPQILRPSRINLD